MTTNDPFPNRGAGTSTGGPGRTANEAPGTVDQVKATAGQVGDKAGQLVDQAKEQAMPMLGNQLGSQKDRAVGGLGTTADALRQTSQHLREQDQGSVAQYIDQAADRVEHFAGYLRQRQLGDLVQDAERFARRQPGLFLGGAVALGLLGARFLKSSGQRGSAQAASPSPGSRPAPWPSSAGWTPDGGYIPGPAGPASAEPAWTSRDDRASATLRGSSPSSSPATAGGTGAYQAPGEAHYPGEAH